MRVTGQTSARDVSPSAIVPVVQRPLLQRQCACGGSSGLRGSCSNCEEKKLLDQPLQRKLAISEPGDQYEQEADRVAEQVMRMPEPRMESNASHIAPKPLVQRRVNGSGTGGVGTAPPIVHNVLNSPGRPLGAATRAFFEPRFGHDFSNVRIHADAKAADSTHSVNAKAYTVGQHIVLGDGKHAGDRDRLLAHELAHTVQQYGATTQEQPHGPAHAIFSAATLYRQSLPEFVRETFTTDELQAYADTIMNNNQIEGGYGSDNKARAYVHNTSKSLAFLHPPLQLQKLLILEMLNGSVTDADQEAVLELLERTSGDDLRAILGPGGVPPADLFTKITEVGKSKRLAHVWAKWTGEISGQAARQATELATERLERAIGDYEKAKRDNLYFARSGPAWETKLAEIRDGQYQSWHDLWAAGNYNRFALQVASFQSARGVPEDDIDGVLGPQTWAWVAGVGEAVASIERVVWPESEGTCTLAARERMLRGYQMATGESVVIPEGKSEHMAHWILHSRTEHMKDLLLEFRATGSAGLAVYLGLGEFVTEADIWAGKLKPGAVLQVWGSQKSYDSMRAATTSGEKFYGTNFVFVRYDTETNERMLTRHMGETEWMSKSDYAVWIAANMNTSETEVPPP